MQRESTAALCLLAVAILVAGTRNGPPNSLFESAGYHVRDGTVYYLNAFPGKAFEIDDADATTFTALDSTYGRDKSHVFIDGVRLSGADVATFELLDRPGFAKDRDHVFQRDRVMSDDQYLYTKDTGTVHVNGNPIPGADPSTFQVLQGAYARDSQHVFYLDHQIADADLSSFRPLDGPYASNSARVYWMGKMIDGADPNTFRVLNANFECSTDNQRAYYRQTVIANADPQTFPAKAVTNCSETSISFSE